MIRFYLATLIFIGFIIGNVQAQCPNNGQNPSSAFPVCGTATFSQSSVPACNGQNIPVPVCSSTTAFTDINPYYYKFICLQSGQIEFSITPNNLNDDYDWQLFDITGRNPNDIYSDASLFVACNWSGRTGVTGTKIGASPANGCEGTGVPVITAAPAVSAGHLYILMVSHFTNTNQSGYNLTFTTASASLITDLSKPKVDTVYSYCGANNFSIKLNKKIRCSTIASNASDFTLNNAAIVGTATGIGCSSAFDTDSIIVTLANPLPSGSYIFNTIKGTDGNTLLDFCDNIVIENGNPFTVNFYQKPNPNFTYTVKNETCNADTLIYSHDGNNATSKWHWTFDGTPATSTLQSQQVVYNSFATRNVKLVIANPACSDSVTQAIPIKDHTLVPKITASRDTTCPNNPETFTDNSLGNITYRFWDFKNGNTSTAINPPTQTYPVLPNNTFYDISLRLKNIIGCDTTFAKRIMVRGTIPTEFDSIIPPTCAANEVKIFFKQDMVCSSIALDGSDFSISSSNPNSVIGASIACANGVGTVVTLHLANALTYGTYNVSLKVGSDGNTVINDCGIATLPKTLSFSTLGHVNPAFTFTTKWGCKADTIAFYHNGNGSTKTWNWSFLDGNPNVATSNVQIPTVIYNDVVNNHNVQLIVSNGVCTDTATQPVNIVNHSIQAKFEMPDTTCGNGNTQFTDSSLGIITNWYWSFGNGTVSNLKQPNGVNYPLLLNYATYPVQLIVKNITNCYDTSAIKKIVVKPSSPAMLDKVDYNVCAPDSFIVHFNSPMLCSTVAPNGSDFTITGASTPAISSAYILNCSNGVGRYVVVKLSQPITVGGYYKLNLVKGTDGNTLYNDCGVETPVSFIGFIAYNNVDASFTNSNKITCTSDTLFLNHIVNNDENKFTWYVNGNIASYTPTLIIPYTTNSTKQIKLITSNPLCADTSSQTFTLQFDKIKAAMQVSNTIVCPTDNIVFTNLSTGNITNWTWNFGNNTPLYLGSIPPAQNYNLPAIKANPTTGNPMLTGDNYYKTKATLVVSNSTPCYDSVEQELTITSNCLIQVPSAFTPNRDGLNDYLYPLNTYKASELQFRVYNRWGRLMYETTGNGKWEGKFLGVAQPAGTYVWTLDYTDKDTGKKFNLKGTVVLIR